MSQSAVILMVTFKSALSAEEVEKVAMERLSEFEALEGLRQKYYLHDANTGVFGGFYVWDSAEALADFKQSELRAGIAKAYQVIGEPRVEVYEAIHTLRSPVRQG